jgi:hypothetical protein
MERYKAQGISLTPHEREMIGILQEEAAEVIVAASKLLRFGKGDRYDNGIENCEQLGLECGDLGAMMSLCIDLGLILPEDVNRGNRRKREKLIKYLQTTPD